MHGFNRFSTGDFFARIDNFPLLASLITSANPVLTKGKVALRERIASEKPALLILTNTVFRVHSINFKVIAAVTRE